MVNSGVNNISLFNCLKSKSFVKCSKITVNDLQQQEKKFLRDLQQFKCYKGHFESQAIVAYIIVKYRNSISKIK